MWWPRTRSLGKVTRSLGRWCINCVKRGVIARPEEPARSTRSTRGARGRGPTAVFYNGPLELPAKHVVSAPHPLNWWVSECRHEASSMANRGVQDESGPADGTTADPVAWWCGGPPRLGLPPPAVPGRPRWRRRPLAFQSNPGSDTLIIFWRRQRLDARLAREG